MKRIYFVRHGESTSNTQNLIQGLADPLTEEGERQARVVAQRVKDLKIDVLIASDAVRAQDTAQAISSEIGLPIETSPLFREGKRPSSLVGQSRSTDAYRGLILEIESHAEDASWRYEDEENYHDLKARADAALTYLLERPEEDILVVTHGHFLRFMLMVMVLEDVTSPKFWPSFAKAFSITNTAITAVYHSEGRWRILTWNDHAHFAD